MPKFKVTITVDADHMDKLDNVRRDLEAAGVKVDDMIPAIGAVFGEADQTGLDLLRHVKGIEAVSPESPDGGIKLPPLNPKIPQ